MVFEPKNFKNRMDVFMQSYFFFWWLKKRTVKSDQKFSKKSQKKKNSKNWPKLLMKPTFLFELLNLMHSSVFDLANYPLFFSLFVFFTEAFIHFFITNFWGKCFFVIKEWPNHGVKNNSQLFEVFSSRPTRKHTAQNFLNRAGNH